jgi:MFS family permease
MAEHFGMRSYGAIFGATSFLTQCAAALGLSLVGVLAEQTGSYALPFALTGVLALVAAAAALAAGSAKDAARHVERVIPATN